MLTLLKKVKAYEIYLNVKLPMPMNEILFYNLSVYYQIVTCTCTCKILMQRIEITGALELESFDCIQSINSTITK